MPNKQLSWCGKLPNHADFIQSYNDRELESIFMHWIVEGQNHIGEQFLHSSALLTHYFYTFKLNSLHEKVNSEVYGILFTSSDEQGRQCPFICFTRFADYFYNDFLKDFENQLSVLKFEFSQLSNTINTSNIVTSFDTFKHQEQNNIDNFTNDNWLQIYPNYDLLTLNVKKMSPIIFRKLMSR